MPEFSGQANQVNQEKLISRIDQVLWSRRLASPGARVAIDVLTSYVGSGATLKISFSDHSGRRHGNIEAKIAGNRHQERFVIPANADTALYADVSFPKHGLKARSEPLILTPPVEISNAEWSAEEARRGDVLTLTADVSGPPDGTVADLSIWEHDEDGAHDLISKFPALVDRGRIAVEWEYEYHEDTDEIPSEEEVEKGYNPPEYFFRVDIGGVTTDSGLLTFKDWIEFRFPEGAGEEYVMHFADGSERRGTFDGSGVARLEDAPPGPVTIEVPGMGNLQMNPG